MPEQDRELTPAREAAVRRLLAEARAAEPVPTDVAARLDRVLVGLGEERLGATPAARGTVVAMAARRRRATLVLAAAAAVVAVGVGVGQVVDSQNGGDSVSSGASADEELSEPRVSSAEEGSSAEEKSVPDATDAPTDNGLLPQATMSDTPPEGTPVGRIRSASFAADANQLRRILPPDAAEGEFVRLSRRALQSGYVVRGGGFDCTPAVWGAGVLVPVLLDDAPAVLAYRPAVGDSQVVDLLQCGTAEILRSTTLRAG